MKKPKKQQDILVLALPLNVGNANAFSMCIDDRQLIDAACRYADQLRKEGVEVFERKQNVLATEKGYFFTLYEEEVVAVESGDFTPENKPTT